MQNLLSRLVEVGIIRNGILWKGYRKPSNIQKKFPDLYENIFKTTHFLPEEAKIGERIYCIKNDVFEITKCLHCGNPVNYKDGKYHEYCSLKCSNADDRVKEKKISSSLKKFGVEFASQSNEIQKKQKNTFRKRYGVDYPFQSKDIRNSMKKKWLEVYGVDNPRKAEVIKSRIKQTKMERYGVESYAQIHYSEDTLKKLNDKEWLRYNHLVLEKPLVELANELEVTDVTIGNYLKKFNIKTKHFSISMVERDLSSFIESLKVTPELNVRNIIPPYELDIYIPNHNLAIEFCGLFWHSDYVRNDRNSHKRKMEMCEKAGIRLLTVFEDEWYEKREIVKSKIKNLLRLTDKKIFARNTYPVSLSSKEEKVFLEKNHIQGSSRCSIAYGLIHEDELVACMTFIKNKNDTFILNRYATSCSVSGGFSKLLKHFQRNNEWKKLISFADLRWSQGDLYQKTGWTLDKILPPDYSYVKGKKRYHKFNFRHSILKKKLPHYDSSLSESENCRNHYIHKIWNCGLKRYVLFNQ